MGWLLQVLCVAYVARLGIIVLPAQEPMNSSSSSSSTTVPSVEKLVTMSAHAQHMQQSPWQAGSSAAAFASSLATMLPPMTGM